MKQRGRSSKEKEAPCASNRLRGNWFNPIERHLCTQAGLKNTTKIFRVHEKEANKSPACGV